MGTFAFLNRTQLGQRANSAGKCASAADLSVICSNDVGGRVRTLGGGCFAANPAGSEQVLATCTLTELRKDTVPDPTDACLGCYLAATGCTLANCRTDCAADPNAAACLVCQLTKGCLVTFFQCSGLPPPPGITLPDAGAPDGSQTDADAASNDAQDVAADMAGDSAPDTAADAGVDTAVETAAETAVETAAETAAETAEETAAETAAETADETASETAD